MFQTTNQLLFYGPWLPASHGADGADDTTEDVHRTARETTVLATNRVSTLLASPGNPSMV